MERRAKVELFEQIRREYEFGVGSIKEVARGRRIPVSSYRRTGREGRSDGDH